MTTHAATPETALGAPGTRSTDELREEIKRLVVELNDAREERAQVLRAEFDQLWAKIRGGEETVH